LTAAFRRAILRQTEAEERYVPEFTTNQWAILFLVLVLGWLLGLLSRSGGKKWKRAYEAERDARAEEQAELEAARTRIAELEAVRPVAARTVEEPAAVAPAATTASTTETLDLTRDDLSLIRGIGVAGQRRLNEEGIYRYSDITGLTPAEEADLERRLGADEGYIEQEQWREQAALLESGQIDQHRATYG
jgi:predicted flap endonuclease-1-like 5' DNA nuclease